jgi:hypothetical protein
LRPLGAQQRRELRSDLQLKIAEYWRQVNPLMILRSAAFDVNPFDRGVTDANDERASSRSMLYGHWAISGK